MMPTKPWAEHMDERMITANDVLGFLLAAYKENTVASMSSATELLIEIAVKRESENRLYADEAASPPENGGWLPIESAPKDETEIILGCFGFIMHMPISFVTNSYWLPACVGSPLLGTDDHCVCCPTDKNYKGKWKNWETFCNYPPTHWMPLPSPPREQQ